MLENIFASIVGGALLVVVGMFIQWVRYRSWKAIRIFEPDPNDKYNHAFYRHFCRQIERASEDILITGDGFEYASNIGIEIASQFERSIRLALENGNVHVKRFQSASCLHPRWIAHLRQLLVDFPGRFHLFFVGGKTESHVASFCVIDADTRRNVSEFMISRKRDFGDASANLAATAVFVHGVKEFSDSLRRRILALESQRNVKTCVTPSDLDAFLGSTPSLYFAYGSNMDVAQMQKRCPRAIYLGVGRLRDHRLSFNRKGSYREGAVASVVPSPGDQVYGVVWELEPDDLSDMDRVEDPRAYERVSVLVDCPGSALACSMYRAFPQENTPKPDQEYVAILLKAAKAAELPRSYIQQLEGYDRAD